MSQTESNGAWPDQVKDLSTSTNNSKADYAIKWGLKVEITDDLIAQICPADLANHVCEFDYVMPNGCDHNCEMLRLCEVYVNHCDYKCPNTNSNDLPCPYVHGVPISCSSVNHQFSLHVEKKALEESLGTSWKPTLEELKREASKKKNAKAGSDPFSCTIKIAGNDCARGHDLQVARLASYAVFEKHQHAGRLVHGTETETFDEKIARDAEQQGTQSKSTMSEEAVPVPADATLTLVVQSLAYATTEETLKAAFEKYGEVKRVNILKKDDGTSKGTGFVDFSYLEHALKAFNAMQGVELDRRALKVKFKGDKGAGGSSKGCFSCGQDGHISRDCPSKASSQGGGDGGCSAGQDQSTGTGWADTEGDTTGGNSWEFAGNNIAQESTGDWYTAGNGATQSSAAGIDQW